MNTGVQQVKASGELAIIFRQPVRRFLLTAQVSITQEDLAEIAGVSLRALKQFEARKGNPTLSTLQKLAGTLGLELSLKVKTTST